MQQLSVKLLDKSGKPKQLLVNGILEHFPEKKLVLGNRNGRAMEAAIPLSQKRIIEKLLSVW